MVVDVAKVMRDADVNRSYNCKVELIANTGTTTGTGTQEEVTNFQVKIQVDKPDILLRPGLSCTADIQTQVVKDVVAVPIQSVTIRSSGSNLSPEEIEQNKEKADTKNQPDNSAEGQIYKLA